MSSSKSERMLHQHIEVMTVCVKFKVQEE